MTMRIVESTLIQSPGDFAMRRLLSLLAGVLFVASFSVTAQANIVLNGSFEDPTDSASPFATLPGGSTAITGWTVTGNSVDWINGYWTAQDGTKSIDLLGSSSGGVIQTLTTVAGQVYQLTYWLSGNPDQKPELKTGLVTINGVSTAFSYFVPSTNSLANMNWSERTLDFMASSTSTTLEFSALATDGNCCFGPALDNVAVAAVPEASTWVMMILGFAGLGFLAYRRSDRRPAGNRLRLV